MRRDYYAVLGIAATAAPREIRQAYRRLARQYSPDVNFWDVTARAVFEEIAEAYRVLSDPDARALYDRFGGRRDAVEAVDDLRVDRMLDPQRAVLIEGRDTSFRRDEVRTRLVGRRAHEVHNALLCRAVVPRRQRICLRMGIDGGEEQRQKSDR